MADTITDNRTLLDAADAVTNFVDLSGGAAGTLDTEILVQGTGSIGQYTTSTRDGLLYDAGAVQAGWANNVFYIWINCGIVGLLDIKANRGFTIRFTGATATNWFEVAVGGSDAWPTAVAGGWVQFVVDIEVARAAAITNGWTNGTVPTTAQCQRVGWSAITGGTMPRMVDNTWMDELRRLPVASPATIVQGRNGGTTDWNFADIVTQLGIGSGIAKTGPGGSIILNGPVQIGINDTTAHGFTATNRAILWDNQEYLADNFYGLTALGNAGGTTNVVLGIKAGTGNDATGAQGGSIQAASGGARFKVDFSDPNLDTIGVYGTTFSHGGTIDFTGGGESVGCIFVDCASYDNTNGGKFVGNKVINAATADGVAFLTINDPADVAGSDFEFSDGHAMVLTAAGTFAFVANTFTGYGADATTDAAVYNNSAGAVTLNVSGGGDSPTVRNGTAASTSVINAVTFTITGLVDNSEVRIYRVSDDVELFGAESTLGGSVEYAYNATGIVPVYIHIHHIEYVFIRLELSLTNSDASVPVQQRFDRAYSNPT